MAGLVGSSNNPVSGITIATILLTSLLLLALMGPGANSGPAAAIMVGAVVCCAAAIGADTMQDLRAGYLLGATPWRQQVGQALGVVAAVLVMAPILNLLQSAYGIGARTAEQPNALLAPQANLMASVARGVFGDGLAVVDDRLRRARRRRDHRARRLSRAAPSRVPHAGARRRHRHLSAARAVRADLRRRPRQHVRVAPPARRRRRARAGRPVVRGRADHRRGADRHLHGDSDRACERPRRVRAAVEAAERRRAVGCRRRVGVLLYRVATSDAATR